MVRVKKDMVFAGCIEKKKKGGEIKVRRCSGSLARFPSRSFDELLWRPSFELKHVASLITGTVLGVYTETAIL